MAVNLEKEKQKTEEVKVDGVPLEKRLEEAAKKAQQTIVVEKADPDITALKQLAVKGLLSEFKEKDQHEKISKLVEGKSLSEATMLIDTFKSFLPKPGAVGGIPANTITGGEKPFSCVDFSNKARTQK